MSATESSKRSRLPQLLLPCCLQQTPCGSEGTTWPAVCLHSLLDPPFCEGAGAAIVSPSELPISPRVRQGSLKCLSPRGSGLYSCVSHQSPAALYPGHCSRQQEDTGNKRFVVRRSTHTTHTQGGVQRFHHAGTLDGGTVVAGVLVAGRGGACKEIKRW